MEDSNFHIFCEITKEKNSEVYNRLMELNNHNIEKAIEMFFSQANTNILMQNTIQKTKSPFECADSEKVALGHFVAEAICLTHLTSVPQGKQMFCKISKSTKIKKKETVDKTMRLSLEPLGFSVAKLTYKVCEDLHPLLCSELISIEIHTVQALNLNTLDSFQILISVSLLPKIFTDPNIKVSEEISSKKFTPEEFSSQREALKILIQKLQLNKTQSALITKESSPNEKNIQNSEEINDQERVEYLRDFEQISIPETTPSSSFKSCLFKYQAQALTWMLERETKNQFQTPSQLHHLWEEYTLESQNKIYINSCTVQVSKKFPESGDLCKGGILADEMGLGKTVMLISLIHTNLKPSRSACKQIKKTNEGGSLIIVPLSLMSQWKSEIEYHGTGLSVIEYYSEKSRNLLDLKNTDVVLTTYGILTSESSNKGPLTQINWFRVILDEAHTIRNRNTATAKAAFKIKADHKWLVTGTPIQNKIDDLYSLVRFLELDPWSDYFWWNRIITQKFNQKNSDSFIILQRLLKPIMLRRTKDTKLENGTPIITLPRLSISTIRIELNNEERNLYDKLVNIFKHKFTSLLLEDKVKTHISCIFELLLRLRQFCDHQYLVLTRCDVRSPEKLEKFLSKFSNDNEAYMQGLRERINNGDEFDCSVCLEPCDDPVLTKCVHVFCRTCASIQAEKNHNCPLCKKPLCISDLKSMPRNNKFNINLSSEWKSSSKIEILLSLLKSSSEPTVIFTQWTSMLDIIEIALNNHQISFCRLDGSLSKSQRESNLNQFKAGVQVLIVSLKVGCQGLNLTCATRVIILDPWWNPAVENQAIERVHRIGQLKDVVAYRLICMNTVEEKILEMQNQKQKIIEGAFTEEVCSMNLENLGMLLQSL
jgi:DNA repair protein RAD5